VGGVSNSDTMAQEPDFEGPRKHIIGFLRRKVRITEDAIDLYQEVCLRAVRTFGRIKKPELFKQWLFGIAKKVALEAYRKRKRSVPIVYKGDLEPSQNEHFLADETLYRSGPFVSSFDNIEGEQERRILKKAIEELPEKLRPAYVLVNIQGVSLTKARKILRIGRTTLYERIEEAKLKLHECLARGMVRGLARDAAGNVIADVRVEIRGICTNRSEHAITDKKAYFCFDFLLPGDYILSAFASGYTKFKEKIQVNVGMNPVTITLSVEPTPIKTYDVMH